MLSNFINERGKVYRFIRFIVYSNVWVGMAVASFTWLTFLDLGIGHYNYILFTFFGTVAVYNYMRLAEAPRRSASGTSLQKLWLQRHFLQAMFFTVLFSLLSAFCYYRIFTWQLFWLTVAPVVVSLLYPVSFKYPFRSFTSLRMIPGFKLLLISFSWGYVTYLIPAILNQSGYIDIAGEFLARSCFVAALTIPFDIRDMNIDTPELKTVPQVMGTSRAKWLAVALAGIYIGWKGFWFVFIEDTAWEFFPWLAGLLIAVVLILNMNRGKTDLYCGFWIESSPVIIAVLVYTFHLIS